MTTTAKSKSAKQAPAKETEDVFAFPDAPSMEVPAAFRDLAENSVNQGKEAYNTFKKANEDAASILEKVMEKTRDGVIEFNAKAVDVAQENTDATFTHAKNIFAVKSFSEVIELQTAFVKKQLNAMQDQAKVFQTMTTKLSEETSEPYKAAVSKTLETFKVA